MVYRELREKAQVSVISEGMLRVGRSRQALSSSGTDRPKVRLQITITFLDPTKSLFPSGRGPEKARMTINRLSIDERSGEAVADSFDRQYLTEHAWSKANDNKSARSYNHDA